MSTGDDAGATKAIPLRSALLEQTRNTFKKWLGEGYDLGVLDAVLAAAASEKLSGDPAWLLVVSGSGAAKTETVIALANAGAHVTSSIASEGALLSATSTKERAKAATGGLLRKIGPAGTLVIKDVTSILSMSGDARASVMAALREVYDGRWERNVGTDGGRTLTWEGRIVLIGAVTTAWDTAHAAIAAMGDRFLLVRLDSTKDRRAAGLQAIANTGSETEMRHELAEAVANLLATVDPSDEKALPMADAEQLFAMADVVTLARTAVTRDYRGDVVDSHQPEMPTRFLKQLTQIYRGGRAIGMSHEDALGTAARCARDSVPPQRLAILLDLTASPGSTAHAVSKRLGKPRSMVSRELQALQMLGVLVCEESEEVARTTFHYSIAELIDLEALALFSTGTRICCTPTQTRNDDGPSPVELGMPRIPSAESGTTQPAERGGTVVQMWI